jgi:hypothetical protein
MMVEALAIFLSCGLVDRAIPCPPLYNLQGWLVYRTDISSNHWPASGVCGHIRGCHVCGLLNLPHDLLWVVLCLGVLRTAGRKAVGVLARTLG